MRTSLFRRELRLEVVSPAREANEKSLRTSTRFALFTDLIQMKAHEEGQTLDVDDPACLKASPKRIRGLLGSERRETPVKAPNSPRNQKKHLVSKTLKSNYGLFNRNNIHIRSWSWNSQKTGCRSEWLICCLFTDPELKRMNS